MSAPDHPGSDDEPVREDLARDARLMGLAVEAARRGRPSPNPHVGAVIATSQGEVLAVGHHERVGEAHAEVAAIARAERTAGATLYVTMDPCNHRGRTGPCTEAVIAAQLARVVIGAPDPAPHVPGSVDRLRAAGIRVDEGVLEAECRALVEDFSKYIRTRLPFVILKAAVTLDGRMATRTGDSRWITGAVARTEAHRLRDRADAVLVGIGTVLADDPQLNVRHVAGLDPVRVVLDRTLRTPPMAKILTADGGETWLLHGASASVSRREALAERGAVLIEVPEEGDRLATLDALRALGARDVVRLLVEGGPTVHGALLDAGQVDQAEIFIAPRIVGDARAPGLAAGEGVLRMAEAWEIDRPRVRQLGRDVWVSGAVRRAAHEEAES